jgi:hypothetical protein
MAIERDGSGAPGSHQSGLPLPTKIQSILLDGHFVPEHGGRNRAGHFFNFNGTAGVGGAASSKTPAVANTTR